MEDLPINMKVTMVLPITIQREVRDGGYHFVTSHQLPGFSFMIEPGEDSKAMRKALQAFIPMAIRTKFQSGPRDRDDLRLKVEKAFQAGQQGKTKDDSPLRYPTPFLEPSGPLSERVPTPAPIDPPFELPAPKREDVDEEPL